MVSPPFQFNQLEQTCEATKRLRIKSPYPTAQTCRRPIVAIRPQVHKKGKPTAPRSPISHRLTDAGCNDETCVNYRLFTEYSRSVDRDRPYFVKDATESLW